MLVCNQKPSPSFSLKPASTSSSPLLLLLPSAPPSLACGSSSWTSLEALKDLGAKKKLGTCKGDNARHLSIEGLNKTLLRAFISLKELGFVFFSLLAFFIVV